MHLLVSLNLGMMWCMRRLKRTKASKVGEVECEDEASGPRIVDVDDEPRTKDKDT